MSPGPLFLHVKPRHGLETRAVNKGDTINDSDRIMALAVPLEVREDLTVYLRYNMLSSMALERQYGTSRPLVVLMSVTPQTETEVTGFLLGAALLHEDAVRITGVKDLKDVSDAGRSALALVADIDGMDAGTVNPMLEAGRLGRVLLRLYDRRVMDPAPLANAIVKAADIAHPMAPCSRCNHALSEHSFEDHLCEVDGCTCQAYARKCARCPHFMADHLDGRCQAKGCRCELKKAGKAKAPAASTGAGFSTPAQSGSVETSVSSGA